MRIALTDNFVRTAKPPERGSTSVFDDTQRGLCLRISAAGTKSFCLVQGKERTRSYLGKYPIVSLAQARAECRRILAEKTLAVTKAKPADIITFNEAVETFLANSENRNRPRTTKDYRRLLTRHFVPSLGEKRIGEITPREVAKIIDGLLGTPSECAHAFAAIKILFRWAMRRHLLKSNPAEGLQGPPKASSRERVLTESELREILQKARVVGFPFGHVLELLILTGQRRSEIGSLEWDWIDTENRTITLPASVTKNKRECPASEPLRQAGRIAERRISGSS